MSLQLLQLLNSQQVQNALFFLHKQVALIQINGTKSQLQKVRAGQILPSACQSDIIFYTAVS